jgi:hypothetical protein
MPTSCESRLALMASGPAMRWTIFDLNASLH